MTTVPPFIWDPERSLSRSGARSTPPSSNCTAFRADDASHIPSIDWDGVNSRRSETRNARRVPGRRSRGPETSAKWRRPRERGGLLPSSPHGAPMDGRRWTWTSSTPVWRLADRWDARACRYNPPASRRIVDGGRADAGIRSRLDTLRNRGGEGAALERHLEKVRVFISHSKHDGDGERVGRGIRRLDSRAWPARQFLRRSRHPARDVVPRRPAA